MVTPSWPQTTMANVEWPTPPLAGQRSCSTKKRCRPPGDPINRDDDLLRQLSTAR